jgi:uncharacterized membrane protein YdcZ (DUF606 family)
LHFYLQFFFVSGPGGLLAPEAHGFFRSFSEGGDKMNALKLMAAVLIVAGIVALLYGKFSYTKETHDIKLGPLEMSVAEKQTVNVPVWAGVLAIVGGGVLLIYGSKKG